MDSLKAEFPEARVQLDADRARVARIQGLSASGQPARAEDLVRSVLRKPVVAAALDLSADLRELCQPVSRNDPQLADYAIVRMQQCVNGVRVFGAELVMSVRLKPAPGIDVLTSSLRPALSPPTRPSISAAAASQKAVAAVKPQSATGTPAPQLVIFVPAVFQLDGSARLAWLVRVESMVVFVDATNGSIVHRYSEAQRGSRM